MPAQGAAMATKIAPKTMTAIKADPKPYALTAATVGIIAAGAAWVSTRRAKRKIKEMEERIEKFETEIEDFILIQNDQIIENQKGIESNHDDICQLAKVYVLFEQKNPTLVPLHEE